MKKEFIPYEQALSLKELGFDEPCIAFYNGRFLDYKIQGGDICSPYLSTENRGECPNVPTFSQAFRWFREKHDLHPSFTRYKSSSINREPNIFTHLYEIQIIDENADKIFHVGDFNSLEEAELECLKKSIEIVKNK